MSWSDDEIDKLVKDAFNEQSFEFRNEYWQDIEKQLPVNKRRKPRAIFYSSVLLVSVVSMGYELFYWNKSTTIESEFKLPRIVVANEQKSKQPSQSNHFLNNQTYKSEKNMDDHIESAVNNGNKELTPVHRETTPTETLSDIAVLKLSENLHAANKLSIDNINSNGVESLSTKETIDLLQLENQLENNNRILKVVNTPKIRYWTETFAGIGQVWANDKSNSHFANTSVGFNAGFQLPLNSFTFSLGAGFKSTFFDKLTINERTKIYGFSVDQLENTYTFKSVVSIALPISLSYAFGRQSFSFNLTPNTNVSCSLNKTQYMNGNKLSDQHGVANVNLFQKYGVETGIGYDYFVNEKLKIGVRCNVQLLKPIASDRFTGTPIKTPFEGQLYIRKILGL